MDTLKKRICGSIAMIKKIVLFTLITLMPQTGFSSETYNCVMTKFIFLQDDEVSEGQVSNFSFEVQRDELVFGQGGYFDNTKLPIRYKNNGWIEASGGTDVFVIEDGRFHYSLVTNMNVRSASGACEQR